MGFVLPPPPRKRDKPVIVSPLQREAEAELAMFLGVPAERIYDVSDIVRIENSHANHAPTTRHAARAKALDMVEAR